jgi:hypothetical protein
MDIYYIWTVIWARNLKYISRLFDLALLLADNRGYMTFACILGLVSFKRAEYYSFANPLSQVGLLVTRSFLLVCKVEHLRKVSSISDVDAKHWYYPFEIRRVQHLCFVLFFCLKFLSDRRNLQASKLVTVGGRPFSHLYMLPRLHILVPCVNSPERNIRSSSIREAPFLVIYSDLYSGVRPKSNLLFVDLL